MKAKRGFKAMALMLALALVISLVGMVAAPTSAQAGVGVQTQMALCLDGSGSISAPEWALMKAGLVAVIADPTKVPDDGSVELSIVQFSTGTPGDARVELPATVLTPATIPGVVATINAMAQIGGNTPLAAGINLSATQIIGSPNFPTALWQVINITTDGEPNVPGNARDAAEAAVAAAVAAGIDEVDVEGVGTTAGTVAWMALDLVYPDGAGGVTGAVIPPDAFPPRPPDPLFKGFVYVVDDWSDYVLAISTKFTVIIPPPPVVPGMTEWGIIAAVAILAPAMVLVLRRKQALA